MTEKKPTLEECKAAVLKDGRYNRVDADDFPDEMWFTLYNRIVEERAERRAIMAEIRAGRPLAEVCMMLGRTVCI